MKRYILQVIFGILTINSSCGYYWIGESKTDIDSDRNFVKKYEGRDKQGFLKGTYVRQDSDFLYTFIFNDDNKVIGTQLAVINKQLTTIEVQNAKLDQIVLKHMPYARVLSVKSNLREFARNIAMKRNLNTDEVKILSEEQFELIGFYVSSEEVIGLSVNDQLLSIVTPELRRLALKRMKQNMSYEIENVLKKFIKDNSK